MMAVRVMRYGLLATLTTNNAYSLHLKFSIFGRYDAQAIPEP